MIKVGLDFHGVLDTGVVWKTIAELLVASGNEVHLLTGSMYGDKLKDQMELSGIVEGVHYTHFFSISDHLINNGIKAIFDSDNGPHFPNKHWNPAKARYCRDNNINLHIDDSQDYHRFFTTPNAIMKNK